MIHPPRNLFFISALLCLAGACTSGKVGQGTGGAAGLGSGGGLGSAGGSGGGSSGSSGSTAGSAGGGVGGNAGAAGTAAAGSTGAAGTTDGGVQVDGSTNDAGGDGPQVGNCTPVDPDNTFSPIAQLSLTGCVDPNDPTKLSPRAVTYEVNSPLWSDGADKTRAFVLPAGQKIHVDPTTGHWDFPIGTVMIKNFMFDGKFVETRLFMHLSDGTWIGYGYEWNGQGSAKQTDATVVGIGRDDVMFDTGKQTVHWYYPSRADCMDCHNDVAGDTLGPSNMQMYRVAMGDTMNQFDKFTAMNLFDTPPTAPAADQVLVTPYSIGDLTASGTTDQKARSYLQANCSHCHQPNDGFIMSPYPNFDLRYGTSLKNAMICNAPAEKGAVAGSTSTTILVPGQPMNSVMWVRMNEPPSEDDTSGRMPQIGTHVVDTMGLQLIGDWITAMTTCP
jgi:uncharacterized repeat protein (TIGR03806 family)